MTSSNINLLGDANYLLFTVMAMEQNVLFDQSLLHVL